MKPPIILIDCPECDGLGYLRDGDEGHLCVNCGGKGKVQDEPGEVCEGCNEPSTGLEAVDNSDPSVGYYEVLALCYECRTAGRRADAEAEGGLIPEALALLGVEDAWLYEGSTVPNKPIDREDHYFTERDYLVGGNW